MPDILEIKPTRMELLKLVRRVELADKGHRLLKQKLDALIGELMKEAGELEKKKQEVHRLVARAFSGLIRAEAETGPRHIRTLAWVLGQGIELNLSYRNVMGVEVPQIGLTREWPGYPERGTLPSEASFTVEEALRSFRAAIESILARAESEERLRRIAAEVEKTRRRVNALEFIVIPRMRSTIKYIRMRLEEYAREDFIRMKRIKFLLREKKSAAAS